MPLLKLTGTSSVLNLSLEHPIHIEEGESYRMALIGFYCDNYMYNLPVVDYIYFWDSTSPQPTDVHLMKRFILDPDYYTLEDLQTYIRQFLKRLDTKVEAENFRIFMFGVHVCIHSPLKFYLGPEVSKLLGYSPPKESPTLSSFYNSSTMIVASGTPNLRPANIIEVHCNLLENSYHNHEEHAHRHDEGALMYMFYPNTSFGHMISEKPEERHYIPLKQGLRKIQHITVTITDQNVRHLQNNFVSYTVYLDLQCMPYHPSYRQKITRIWSAY